MRHTRWAVAALSLVAASIIGSRVRRSLLSEWELPLPAFSVCGTTGGTGMWLGLTGEDVDDVAVSPRSFECPRCARTYTTILPHNRCAVCRDGRGFLIDTFASDRSPIYDADKAKALKDTYAEFERRYARHIERRKRLQYPDPDELGAMEARKEKAARVARDKAISELEELLQAS